MTAEKPVRADKRLDRALAALRGLVSRVRTALGAEERRSERSQSNLAGPLRTAASLRFCPSRAEARARERRQNEPKNKPYRDAAVEWFTQRLDEGLDVSVEQVALVAADPRLARRRWRSLRKRLGKLDCVEGVKCEDIGGFASSAGSYEPEVYGYAPTRVLVSLAITGSKAEADLVVRVWFPNGPELPPSAALEAIQLRSRTRPPRPLTDEERELERLSEAVCAAPDDDAPRMQLADFWIARGEPRGEFVRAQLAGHEAQAQDLLARHGAEWTDGLPVATQGRVYHRGFLAEARVECAPFALTKSVDNPAWNLLRVLHLSTHSGAESELLKHAWLDGLRQLRGAGGESIHASGFPPKVTRLHVSSRLDECPPGLEELEIETSRFDELWVFSAQRRTHLKLLRITVDCDPEGADLMTLARLLAEPLPARVVLIGRSGGQQSVEAWRLTVTAAGWEFSGDERVLQTLRRACKKAGSP